MRQILTLFAAFFSLVLEEPLIMLGLLHNYNVYNVETGEYTTVSTTTSLTIGHQIQAPWYSTSLGCQVVVLDRTAAYILTT